MSVWSIDIISNNYIYIYGLESVQLLEVIATVIGFTSSKFE